MSDAKSHQFRPPLYHTEAPGEDSDGRRDPQSEEPRRQATEQKGWDAYRKWLSSVSGKTPSQRAPLDASIYSWKGYQNWADRVRQTWKTEES